MQRGEEATAPEGIDPSAHTPEAVIARMKADGAICAKSFFDRGGSENLPVPRLDTIRALVGAAHAVNMPVLLHAYTEEAQTFALDAGVDIIAHGLWDWNAEPPTITKPTLAIKAILDRVIAAKVGWQPTMQVAYGFRDLFDPAYLSDPRLQRVIPASLIAWYRSPEGQWFHDMIAKGLLSKELIASADIAAQWKFVRELHHTDRRTIAPPDILPTECPHPFGTDSPAASNYANPPGLNGRLEIPSPRRQTDSGTDFARRHFQRQAFGLNNEIGTVQAGSANRRRRAKIPLTIEALRDRKVIFTDEFRIVPSTANRAAKQ